MGDCAGWLAEYLRTQCNALTEWCLVGRSQIEEGLLGGAKPSGPAQPPSQKRRRTSADESSEPAVSGDEGAWDALAGLYRDLGEDHLAHTCFAAHVARLGSSSCQHGRGTSPD